MEKFGNSDHGLARKGQGAIMHQLSLIDNTLRLSGVLAGIRAAMRDAAGASESEGRKLLADRLNDIAQRADIKLTGGNSPVISKATLDKWLSPSDVSHPPSILAVLAFCMVTDNYTPLQVMLRAVGMDLMTPEDKRFRDYGKADLEMKAARKRKKQLEERL